MFLLRVVVIFALALAHVESSFEQRIIGGAKARISQFPFYVSVRSYQNDYLCGGTIIDRYWIVTSAQCVYSQIARNLFVVAGSDSFNDTRNRFGVLGIYIHPRFNSMTRTNDTAILRLSRSLSFNNNISSITLAKTEVSVGKTLQLCGFGATAYPFQKRSNLTFIETKSISREQCSANLRRQIDKSSLCTKGKTTQGACVGDLGSPLIKRGGFFGTTKLHGILSWDSSCAGGWSDLYASIAVAKPWISQITGVY